MNERKMCNYSGTTIQTITAPKTPIAAPLQVIPALSPHRTELDSQKDNTYMCLSSGTLHSIGAGNLHLPTLCYDESNFQ